MNLRFISLAIGLLVFEVSAQDNPNQPWLKNIPQSKYEIIADDPSILATTSVNFDYLYTTIPFKNLAGATLDVGLSGTMRPSPDSELNGMFHIGLVSFEKPSGFLFDFNSVKYFSSRTVKKDVDVLLKYSTFSMGNSQYASSRSVTVPDRNVLKKFGIRTGFYHRKNAFIYEDYSSDIVSPFSQTGIYGGIQFFNANNVRIKMNENQYSAESGFIFYLDFMLLKTRIADDAMFSFVKNNVTLISPVAVRAGAIFKPVMPQTLSSRNGFFGNIELRAEFGWRAVEGAFFHTGAGWNFLRD
ncbi:MAG: hypothetical protein ACO3FI_02545 [Cyclobacteriaceae bacterium]